MTSLRIALVIAIVATVNQAATADDGPSLIVRDVVVFEGSNYETTMNARARVQSTLPRSLAGRRPINDEITKPVPVGMITFEGKPQTDIDVLVEYRGRVMTHIPAASSRAKRLLWGRLSLSQEPTAKPIVLPTGHWLSSLDHSKRLWLQGPATAASQFILYDIEHSERPLATITVDGDTWSAKNTGRDAVNNVAVFRPTGQGRYQLGVIESVEGYSKTSDKNDKPAADDAADSKPDVDPAAREAVGALVNGFVAAVTGNANEAAATEKPKTSTAGKKGVSMAWSFSEPADAIAAVDEYVSRFQDLGQPERDYIASLLLARGLNERSATLVYELAPKTLERIAPLELTPQPDRVVRVGLVVVTDADPSLSKQVDSLIAQLGDTSWSVREEAESKLKDLGRASERNLQAALKNSDHEIRHRAKRILDEFKNTAK